MYGLNTNEDYRRPTLEDFKAGAAAEYDAKRRCMQASMLPLGYGVDSIVGDSTQASAPPPTMSEVQKQLASLVARLANIDALAQEIAGGLGGVYPTGGSASAQPRNVPPSGIVEMLDEGLMSAHHRVANLEDSLSRIARALS